MTAAASGLSGVPFSYHPTVQHSKRPGIVTLRDVAQAAGVGVMTVSRVINEVPGKKVSEATAARVRAVIESLGYEPNHVARNLRGSRSGVIGLIITHVNDPFCADCARAVEAEARACGYVTMLVASDENPALEEQQIAILRRRQVEGLLIIPASRKGPHPSAARLRGIPVVAVDRPIAGLKSDSVMIYNRASAREVTGHLIAHGHRRIAMVGYGAQIHTVRERIRGYRDAMIAAGLNPLVDVIGSDAATAMDQTRRLITTPASPTAVVGINSMVVHGVIQAARDMSLEIPRDLAVAGFDDFPWAGFVSPALTLVHQPSAEIGRRAAAMLFERLRGHFEGPPRGVLLQAPLIIRESCGCHAALERSHPLAFQNALG